MFKGIRYFISLCWGFDKKYLCLLFLNQIISIIVNLSSLIIPKIILDALFVNNNLDLTIKIVLLFTFMMLILNIFGNIITKNILVSKMAVYKEFQIYLCEKLSNLKYENLESDEYLNIKSKAERFLYGNGNGFASVLESSFNIFGKSITLLGIIGIISQLSILLVLFIILLVLVNAYLNSKTQKKNISINMEKSVYERKSSYFSNLFQNFRYGKEIRVYNLNEWLITKYAYLLNEMQKFYVKLSNNGFKLNVFSSILLFLQQIISYMYVIKRAYNGVISIGDFSMYLSSITSLSSNLKDIIYILIDMQQYTSYFEAFQVYMNLPEINRKNLTNIETTKDFIIEFKDVCFKYEKQTGFALKNVNFQIKSGEKISIVGLNGAGKSTFIKLLLRIYKPTSGTISYNGKDIEDINYNQYLSLFSTVFQDFMLFSFPLKDNICLNKELDQNKINNVIELLDLNNIIDTLSDGINTTVYRDFDSSGFTPSGGQAQKIAIARALYRDTPIVILDEPTASLDPSAEYELYKSFNEIFKYKTSIFISHKLASTSLSDVILVFEKGELIECGNHNELINKENGVYFNLYKMQINYYEV